MTLTYVPTDDCTSNVNDLAGVRFPLIPGKQSAFCAKQPNSTTAADKVRIEEFMRAPKINHKVNISILRMRLSRFQI